MLLARFGPEGVRPRDAALAGHRREVGVVGADRQSGLVAVVDPPADVVEGRRDDRDREDVLHRGGQDVLAPDHAGLVAHEPCVDQPHEHDREEVELLAEDRRVCGLALRAGSLLEVLHLREDEVDHAFLPCRRARASRAIKRLPSRVTPSDRILWTRRWTMCDTTQGSSGHQCDLPHRADAPGLRCHHGKEASRDALTGDAGR